MKIRHRRWLFLVLIMTVLLTAAACNRESSKEDSSAEGEAEQTGVEFPCELEDGKLLVSSLFQYTGTNPDCNEEYGEDIASLEVTNQSEEYLANAEFVAELEDGTKLVFMMEDVPAGQTVWAYAEDNSSYDLSVGCKSIACEAEFEDTSSLLEDQVTIEVQGTEVTLINISKEELTDLNVYCHCLFEEAYFGGLTYTYPVETIPVGESVTLQAEECYLGQAEVVRITQND